MADLKMIYVPAASHARLKYFSVVLGLTMQEVVQAALTSYFQALDGTLKAVEGEMRKVEEVQAERDRKEERKMKFMTRFLKERGKFPNREEMRKWEEEEKSGEHG